ncbi:MAG: hypothetical protein NTW53_18610, partial [Burkholderiales bacterium]|nr:hypothetical protein [Burkholderiales bacterium]
METPNLIPSSEALANASDELPCDFRIPTVEQNMAIPEVMDEADCEGEIHRGVQGGGGAVDRCGS